MSGNDPKITLGLAALAFQMHGRQAGAEPRQKLRAAAEEFEAKVERPSLLYAALWNAAQSVLKENPSTEQSVRDLAAALAAFKAEPQADGGPRYWWNREDA